jgi:hypothetical protein
MKISLMLYLAIGLFTGATLFTYAIDNHFYAPVAVVCVFLDISLTYHTYKLSLSKHPEADKNRMMELEQNGLMKFMVKNFGITGGGLFMTAFASGVLTLYLTTIDNPEVTGLLVGVYLMVILTHIANIRTLNGYKEVRNGEVHTAKCCRWARGDTE